MKALVFPHPTLGFPGGTVVKDLPASAWDTGGAGSIPGTGRSLGEGNGNPLQYSCLENPMYRGAWWTLVRRSWTERLSTHAYSMPPTCEGADVLVLLKLAVRATWIWNWDWLGSWSLFHSLFFTRNSWLTTGLTEKILWLFFLALFF